ncbi:hypothetical protein F4803DRAFT_530342 [Xylaria telfairii]|nr:hypothetical protein F4803DRAFT_530342 [Xylaria telfairii]
MYNFIDTRLKKLASLCLFRLRFRSRIAVSRNSGISGELRLRTDTHSYDYIHDMQVPVSDVSGSSYSVRMMSDCVHGPVRIRPKGRVIFIWVSCILVILGKNSGRSPILSSMSHAYQQGITLWYGTVQKANLYATINLSSKVTLRIDPMRKYSNHIELIWQYEPLDVLRL